MPELPDVEGHRRALSKALPGARVRDVTVLDAGVLRNVSIATFRDWLIGCRFDQPERHGKWLILATDGPTVLVHNGMTGHPVFTHSGGDGANIKFDRLVIHTDHGDLHYADQRKLGGLWLLDHDDDFEAVTGPQGPDAMELSESQLRTALEGRRGPIKTVLMNQKVLAGLGNMLSDEILWRARLHPTRTVRSLSTGEIRGLHRQLQRTLRAAVSKGQIPRIRGWLSSRRDQEEPNCPRCATLLRRTTVGGRTSLWCPHCQA